MIALAQQLGKARGRPIGVYPETKHPTLLPRHRPAARGAAAGVAREARLEPPRRAGLHPVVRAGQPARAAQEDAGPARAARERRRRWSTPPASKEIADYADGLGPEKRLVVPVNADGSLGRRPTSSRARTRPAHRARLDAADRRRIPARRLQGTAEAEFEQFRESRRRRHLHRLSRRRREGLRPAHPHQRAFERRPGSSCLTP